MRVKMLVGLAVLLAVALPAQAKAGSFVGVVVAKQSQQGTLVLAGAHGAGLTVHSPAARLHVGDRVRAQGLSGRGAALKAAKVTKLGHVHHATIRGTVVRKLASATLLATGHSVIRIRAAGRRLASANDHGGLGPGDVVQMGVTFDEDDDEVVQAGAPVQLGQATTVQIEGEIVSVSPLVVSIEGLPVTITVPAGMTLPTLATGDQIEITVQVGSANVFTLVTIGGGENQNQPAQNNEIEVKGVVVTSTATSLVINSNGTMTTFVPPAGATLPTVAVGTFVEARGTQQNGVNTLERLRTANSGDEGGGSGGGGGGDDDD